MCNPQDLFGIFSADDRQKKLFLDLFKHMCFKNIHMHNLRFVYIVVFDVETDLENAKLVILYGL